MPQSTLGNSLAHPLGLPVWCLATSFHILNLFISGSFSSILLHTSSNWAGVNPSLLSTAGSTPAPDAMTGATLLSASLRLSTCALSLSLSPSSASTLVVSSCALITSYSRLRLTFSISLSSSLIVSSS